MAGPPKLYPDRILAPLVAGSKVRIMSALRPGETVTEFIRKAIDADLERRESAQKRDRGV